MKTRTYSLLFAIHLLYAFGTLLPVNSLPGGLIIEPPSIDTEEVPTSPDSLPGLPSTCLVTSLSSSSQLLIRTGMLACLNEEQLETKFNDDNYEAMHTALKETLTSSLCTVDTVLKTGDTLKQLGTPTSKVVKTLVNSLRPVLEKSGLSKPVMKTLCSLLQPAFTFDCLPALLAVEIVKLIEDLKLQTCKGQNEYLFYQDIISILKRMDCVLESPTDLQVPTKPASIGNQPISLFKRDLGDAQLPQQGPKDPVVMVACTAVNLLLESVTPV